MYDLDEPQLHVMHRGDIWENGLEEKQSCICLYQYEIQTDTHQHKKQEKVDSFLPKAMCLSQMVFSRFNSQYVLYTMYLNLA